MGEVNLANFTDVSVLLGPGVYALAFAEEVVYIGKATRLLARIYAHRYAMERAKRGQLMYSMKEVHFSKVTVFPCAASDLDRVERELIAKHNPRYNVKLRTIPARKVPSRFETRPVRINVGGTELVLGVGVPNERAIARRA